jgi:hypothetical protein
MASFEHIWEHEIAERKAAFVWLAGLMFVIASVVTAVVVSVL